MEPLLRVTEIAECLQIPVSTVYRLTAEKKLPVLRVGAALRYSLDEVLKSISSNGDNNA